MSLSLQIENINKEIKIIKKNQLELKSTIYKMKNSLESLSSISELAEEGTGELEDRWIKLCNLKNRNKKEQRKMNRA